MEKLLPPVTDKFKGCELIYPDTVFFCGGAPKIWFKNDKDYCLSAIRQTGTKKQGNQKL